MSNHTLAQYLIGLNDDEDSNFCNLGYYFSKNDTHQIEIVNNCNEVLIYTKIMWKVWIIIYPRMKNLFFL